MTAFSDETGRDAFVAALASLAAAISLLERTPRSKKAAASDKMFDQMIVDYKKALEEGRAALSAAPVAQEPVAIKLLEWRDRGPAVHPQWEAVSVVGSYFIATIKGGQFNWWTTALRGKIEQHSLNDAKDAAQADYEKRIRSALSNPPATPAGVGADEIARIIATKCFDPRVTTTEERG
jgi:hypothetical protein